MTQGDNYFSPVWCTSGSFPHTWEFRGIDDIYFIKAGSKYTLPAINSGQEPFSEYYASQLAKFLKFSHVDYFIRYHRRADSKLDIVTECKCYTTESKGSISAACLGLRSFEEMIAYCKQLSREAYNDILNMLFLDCLTLNTDRHFGNIEFFIDNRTQEILGLVPIYDDNFALCPRYLPGEAFNLSDYIVRDNRSFDDLYRLVKSGKSFRREFTMLSRFRFVAPSNVECQPGRVDFLNWLIQERVAHLRKIN